MKVFIFAFKIADPFKTVTIEAKSMFEAIDIAVKHFGSDYLSSNISYIYDGDRFCIKNPLAGLSDL